MTSTILIVAGALSFLVFALLSFIEALRTRRRVLKRLRLTTTYHRELISPDAVTAIQKEFVDGIRWLEGEVRRNLSLLESKAPEDVMAASQFLSTNGGKDCRTNLHNAAKQWETSPRVVAQIQSALRHVA